MWLALLHSIPSCVQVTELRELLGNDAVPCPKMDIGGAFTSLAKAALGIDGFFPYNSDINFILGDRKLCATGHTCYQARSVASNCPEHRAHG